MIISALKWLFQTNEIQFDIRNDVWKIIILWINNNCTAAPSNIENWAQVLSVHWLLHHVYFAKNSNSHLLSAEKFEYEDCVLFTVADKLCSFFRCCLIYVQTIWCVHFNTCKHEFLHIIRIINFRRPPSPVQAINDV